jgi:hypothetical protein
VVTRAGGGKKTREARDYWSLAYSIPDPSAAADSHPGVALRASQRCPQSSHEDGEEQKRDRQQVQDHPGPDFGWAFQFLQDLLVR